MDLIGVVDTMFARYDMGAEAVDELSECPGYGTRFTVVRRTVPGFKDLAVAAKKLIEEEGCRIVVALGMPGREKIFSVMMSPPNSAPTSRAMTVTRGTSALRSAWRTITRRRGTPLARAVRM